MLSIRQPSIRFQEVLDSDLVSLDYVKTKWIKDKENSHIHQLTSVLCYMINGDFKYSLSYIHVYEP